VDLVILLVAFVVILAGAELFTNGIEWFGRKLDLAEGAVGSVLAAVGTALPETTIPFIAIVFGSSHASTEVGVGAVLGAPFMLATLAMCVTGLAVIGFRNRRDQGIMVAVDRTVLLHDLRWFGLGYALAIGAAFLPAGLELGKAGVAIILLTLYGLYVRAHFAGVAGDHELWLAPLRLRRLDRGHRDHPVPRLRVVGVQVLLALGCIVVGAAAFVRAVQDLAASLGIGSAILALVIAPIATELPEKLNSVIWVRQGKDTLALGNITGAMVFQSAIPTSIVLLFAPTAWSVSADSALSFLSAGIAVASVAAIFLPLRLRGTITGRALTVGGVFYVAYLGLVVGGLARGAA
jgi:cation:H+ antiporter